MPFAVAGTKRVTSAAKVPTGIPPTGRPRSTDGGSVPALFWNRISASTAADPSPAIRID
jgi:hypothetical protein